MLHTDAYISCHQNDVASANAVGITVQKILHILDSLTSSLLGISVSVACWLGQTGKETSSDCITLMLFVFFILSNL